MEKSSMTKEMMVGDKNSFFDRLSVGETGLGVNKNLTAGYCGRNGGLQYGGLSLGRAWMWWALELGSGHGNLLISKD